MDRGSLLSLGANDLLQRGWAALSVPLRRLLHKPLRVSAELTRRCNLRCLHCAFPCAEDAPDRLSLGQWTGILRSLRRELGPYFLAFGHGESLLEPMLFPLLAEAAALGARTLLVSNGTLIEGDVPERLCAAGLGKLQLSIDGTQARTHDLGRGTPGTHAQALRALDAMRRLPGCPSIGLNAIIAGHNLPELAGLVRWAAAEGLDGVSFQPLMRTGPDWGALWPRDPGAVRSAIGTLLEMKDAGFPIRNSREQLSALEGYFVAPDSWPGGLTCAAGEGLLIRQDGALQFCVQRGPFGDLRREEIGAVLRSDSARLRYREVLECRQTCLLLNCNHRPSLRTIAEGLGRSLRQAK
ncbi:MAG: hypothetical protein A2X36_13460 [Elusimicrobia bacterium GWA2_69_24]|nr:MAG: hypothetical protein A2X36_13460 [Elusimicrobia bacterium GWA2_69_24]